MDLGKGRISGGSFAEMKTAVTHPHQHGGKANSSFAAPAVNVNESLFFFFAQNANWKVGRLRLQNTIEVKLVVPRCWKFAGSRFSFHLQN